MILKRSLVYGYAGVDGRGAWRVDEEERERPVKLVCEAAADEFFLELRGPNQFAVRLARTGQYLRAEQNGLVRPDADELPAAGPASKLSAYLFEF